MSAPSQEAIDQCTLLTGCSQTQAIEFLKRYDNDANRAINAFLDNPDAINLADQGSFGATIDDGLNYERRTSGKTTTAEGDNFVNVHPYMNANEMLSPVTDSQETGVVPVGGESFGPATKEQYDERSWGMTLFQPSKRAVQPDADPERRRRDEEQPAFLRNSEETYYLPAFITILHSIPEVRESLLLRNRVLDDYGFDEQWWNGLPIQLPEEASMDAEKRQYFGILTEVQRLMAFLDGTARAYGNADHLADLASNSCSSPEEALDKFMALWQEAAVSSASEKAAVFAKLFQSFCMKVARSSTGEEESGLGEPFRLIEAYCYPDRQADLYDTLDESIWPDYNKEVLDDIWLEYIAPVLPVKLDSISTDGAATIGVKIPFTLYVDRYLPEQREWAKALRQLRLTIDEERQKLTKQIRMYDDMGDAGTRSILMKAKQAVELTLNDCWTKGLIEDERRLEEAPFYHEKAKALISKFDAILPQIDEKITSLNSRKQALLSSLQEETRKFTTKTDDPATSAQHEYTLRGFSTSPHITYLRCPASEDSEPSTTFVDPASGERRQWWRISYSVVDGQSGIKSRATPPENTDFAGYNARPITIAEAETAASKDARSALFVYVNEKALAGLTSSDSMDLMAAGDLPEPLEKFLKSDNEAFERECRMFEEELARKKEASDQQPSNIVALEGRQYESSQYDARHPPPIPPRPVKVLGYEMQDVSATDAIGEDQKSEDDQPIKIEVENEQGNWDMMHFPTPTSTLKQKVARERAARLEQEQQHLLEQRQREQQQEQHEQQQQEKEES
ncbi:hypothetical protein KEM56_004389 [Ascosphaera pollenicola]|nr:hypothetical protein KEM56_004389 [Ascosphaera pollenicola]